ncbi:MAG: hypothetical protein ABI572_00475 [Actinomycetota bacterium]
MRPPRPAALAAGVLLGVAAATSAAFAANKPAPRPPASGARVLAAGVECGTWGGMQEVGPSGYGDTTVDEISGVAESHQTPGVLWMILDNGNMPWLYAMGPDGASLGRYRLPAVDANGHPVENIDWEDISVQTMRDGRQFVWIADTGTIPVARTTVDVYRVREPLVDPAQPPVDRNLASWAVNRYYLGYPAGEQVRNGEAMFVDPPTGNVFVVSKKLLAGSDLVPVWRAKRTDLSTDPTQPTTLSKVAEITGRLTTTNAYGPTAADITSNGNWIAMKHLDEVMMWPRSATVVRSFRSSPTAPCNTSIAGSVPTADVGESLAFDQDAAGAVMGAYSTLDSPNAPNPPLHLSGCGDQVCLAP